MTVMAAPLESSDARVEEDLSGTCTRPAPDSDAAATLEDARAHETHHKGGDVSAEYYTQEGAGTGVGEAQAQAGAETDGPILVIVMGVSGSGKSTLGGALAAALGLPFTDADALHPPRNIAKMSAGVPLADADRAPWLAIVRRSAVETCAAQAAAGARGGEGEGDGDGEKVNGNGNGGPKAHGVVVGCSALKKKYRDVLRGSAPGPAHRDSVSHEKPHEHDADSPSDSISRPSRPPETNPEGAHHPHRAPHLPAYFVYIKGARAALLQRMEHRRDHFMKAGMLDSQLRDLEAPDETGEEGVVVVPLDASTEEQVRLATEGLKALGALRRE